MGKDAGFSRGMGDSWILQLVVSSSCVAIQLWWEEPTLLTQQKLGSSKAKVVSQRSKVEEMSTSRTSRRVERKRKSESTGRDPLTYDKSRFSKDNLVLPIPVIHSD